MPNNISSAQSANDNNFDLIRLIAATQVAVKHILIHMGISAPYIDWLGALPGVPIFFLISGFLIFKSCENSPSLKEFFLNRALRIYPGLICCVLLSVLMVWLTGYFSTQHIPASGMLFWLFGQTTILQIYNPDFMRGFGVGVLNGSLWTISVELSFYLITPLILILVRWRASLWPVMILIFCCANVLMAMELGTGMLWKLFTVSFVPWLYMFLLGAWISTKPHWLAYIKRCPLPIIIFINVAIGLIGYLLGLQISENGINPLSYFGLALLIFKLAYSKPRLSENLLKRNDVSYGIYIYHMPIANLMIFLGFHGEYRYLGIVVLAMFMMAILSWKFIEKPALRLKHTTLHKY